MEGDEMLDSLEFERQISELSDRGLLEFTARQVWECRKDISGNTKRIHSLETTSKKFFAISGGAGTMIGGAIVAAINYFTGRG